MIMSIYQIAFIVVMIVIIVIFTLYFYWYIRRSEGGYMSINKVQEKKYSLNKIIKYRNKHPRCRYCIFLKENASREFLFDGVAGGEFMNVVEHKCIIKDKRIKLNNRLKGCFCEYYEPKELTIDEI